MNFVIIFKNDLELYHLIKLETPPDGVEIYDNDWGLRISVDCNDPEMLDEYFGKITESVKSAISDLEEKIDALNDRRRTS